MGGRLEEGRPMRRYGLRDDQWERIKDFLPGSEGHVGGTAKDNRLFVEAVLYRYRTGCPWRDLPDRFGYGRAPQGERLVQKVLHGNWKTLTFIAALRHNRVTALFVCEGAMNEFLAPTLKRGDIV